MAASDLPGSGRVLLRSRKTFSEVPLGDSPRGVPGVLSRAIGAALDFQTSSTRGADFAPCAPLLLLALPALGSRVPEAARAWAVGAWAMVILSFAVGALFEAFFAPS